MSIGLRQAANRATKGHPVLKNYFLAVFLAVFLGDFFTAAFLAVFAALAIPTLLEPVVVQLDKSNSIGTTRGDRIGCSVRQTLALITHATQLENDRRLVHTVNRAQLKQFSTICVNRFFYTSRVNTKKLFAATCCREVFLRALMKQREAVTRCSASKKRRQAMM